MTATATESPALTKSDTRKAEERVQLMLAKSSLLRKDLRNLWGESSPAQATALQRCLQLESEVTDRLQRIRDHLQRIAGPGADHAA